MTSPVRLNFKQGDRLPVVDAILEETNPQGIKSAVPLAGYTVKFLMRKIGATVPKVDAAATIVDAPTGAVRYAWGANDLDTDGNYEAEFEATRIADGFKRTFPTDGYLAIVVGDDIG